MLKKNKAKLFVIAAPSGAGKTTLRDFLLSNHEELYFSVSTTTRQPRSNEIINKDYHFISKEVYQQHIAADDFLEHAEVFGNYYGTLAAPIEAQLAMGNHVLLDVDTKGAKQVKAKMPDAVLIFIMPPSLEELEFRLRNRGTDSEEVINKRLREAQFEIDQSGFFEHVIVNDQLEKAQEDLDLLLYPKS